MNLSINQMMKRKGRRGRRVGSARRTKREVRREGGREEMIPYLARAAMPEGKATGSGSTNPDEFLDLAQQSI